MEEKEKEEDFKDKLIRSKSAEIKKQFIPLPEGFEEEGASYPQEEPSSKSEPEMTPLDTIAQAVLTIIRENSDEDGWVSVSYTHLQRLSTAFPKNQPTLIRYSPLYKF